MAAEYYAVWVRLNGVEQCFIWHTDDEDGVWVDQERRFVPSFGSFADATSYADAIGVKLSEASRPLLDLDAVRRWAIYPGTGDIDHSGLLDVWNLGEDFARSLDLPRSRRNMDLYDRLFWGCNLPSVTPPGQHYVPDFSDEEEARLRSVLREEVGRIESALHCRRCPSEK
ncbi:MAG: hypothetical protein ACYS9X_22205 [Planctomycetota bacterium]|jgi:hypothetical protein